MAAQKTLLQQVQDLENESREMADFMAEEKNALAECLREAESEVREVVGWPLLVDSEVLIWLCSLLLLGSI